MHIRKVTSCLLVLSFLLSCQPSDITHLNLENLPPEVELFGEGLVSTPLYERDIAVSPDGREIIYTLGDTKQRKRFLVQIRKKGNRWTKPQILNISGEYQDIEPFFAEDGNRLFFASNRPLYSTSSRTDYNIWYADREGDQWGSPVALPANINTEGNEFYPSVSRNGNLYFTATRADGVGREDIFRSEWKEEKYQNPEALDSTINTLFFEFNAFVSPEEDILIFSSFGRPDEMGGGDLYLSERRPDGSWSVAKRLDSPINSEQLDYGPFIDFERGNFYFTSERAALPEGGISTVEELFDYATSVRNGYGNIYRVSLDILGIK